MLIDTYEAEDLPSWTERLAIADTVDEVRV